MPELEALTHLASSLFVARLPEDIDPGTALNPANWRIIGGDLSRLPVDNVMPASPPFSWRDFLVQTAKPANQQYNLTILGLRSPQGTPLAPYTHSWTPLQPPQQYPPTGILKPSLDGNCHGSRLEVAIFKYPDWVSGVLGIDSEDNEYPFTQSATDSRYWTLETSIIPNSDAGFKVHPVPAEGHEEDFTEDELADLNIPLLRPPFPPLLPEVMLSNLTRPGSSVFYPTDTIVPIAIAFADQLRGAKVMIARLPFDPSILLPYYPPGANDPNSPNYDPEAPEDGSANPPWWRLPLRPGFHPALCDTHSRWGVLL